jgi:SAM-dependent methyltransferase
MSATPAAAAPDFDALWLKRNKRGWSPRLYEGWFTHNLFQAAIRTKEQEALYGALLRAVRKSHEVLEIGPGTGHYTVPLAAACHRVTAVDSSPAMLDHLRQRMLGEGLDNTVTLEGCATALPLEDAEFDGFLAAGIFNYLPDLPPVLVDLAARLRPGGWAIFSVPLSSFGGHVYRASERLSGHRIWTYTPAEIETMAVAAGLCDLRLSRVGVSRTGMAMVVEGRRP